MAAVEVLVAARDREKYGIPQPLMFDLAKLDDLPYSVSGAWEDELLAATKKGIGELLGDLSLGRAASKKALVWLACRMAEVPVPSVSGLDIAWRHVKTREVAPAKAGGAEDPSSGSSGPPSETAP